MRRRGKKKRAPEVDENGSASERLKERISLGLTLVAVSAFAIFAGYLIGQYAILWIAAPILDDPQPGGARLEAASTQFREETISQPAGQAASQPAASAQAASNRSGQVPTAAPSAGAGSAAGSGASSNGAAGGSSASGGPGGTATAVSAGSAASSQSGPAGSPQSVSVHRVQVGRYATRAEAEALAERLRTGRPAVPDAWVLFDPTAGAYRVQAGAFSSRERALEFAAELSARGYEAYVVP